mmetsp:Transcript_44172/g.103977  ORF Transcript_44172/g.103977 Transcript_44172/m.103977 type:complete len:318 (+) Transcript_44172:79-1032(+)|eukprot:3361964-Rhodomonas_salina.3
MGDTLSVPEPTGEISPRELPEKEQKQRAQAQLFRLIEKDEQAKLEHLLRTKLPYIELNTPNKDGDTALHVAARLGELPVCKLLINCGADRNALNSSSKTALDVARDSNKKFCESYLNTQSQGHQTVSRTSSRNSKASTEDGHHVQSTKDVFDRAASAPIRQNKIKAWATAWVSLGRNGPTNAAPLKQKKVKKEPEREEGEDEIPVVALYNYSAQPGTPFPPDFRKELSLVQGDILMVEEMKSDGWAIVRVRGSHKEGYVPGNYLSLDGKNSMVDEKGNAYCAICGTHRKSGHKHTDLRAGHHSHAHNKMNKLMTRMA